MLDRLIYRGMPLAMTLGLHLLLLGFLIFRMPGQNQVVASVPKSVPIQATIVKAEDVKPKPKPKAEPKKKPPQKKTVTPKKDPPKKEVKKDPPKTVVKKDPEPVKKEPVKPKVEEPKLTPEQLAAITKREMEQAMAQESGSASEATATLRDQIAAVIRQAVVGRWTRPPSARNGMVAVLTIQMVPTGEVVGVSVTQSSGNVAFDQSALNAVERAAPFPEVKQLDPKEFERDFRRFQMIFRPEDLRY